MIASTASRTGLSLLAVTLGVLALVAGPASAQGLGDSYGVCCYGAGEECADSDALTCAGGGYVFFPYAEDSSYNCDWYCGGGAPECGDGVPDSGECGPDGSCLEDCSEYKDCPDYSNESECSFAAGCQWYYDDYGYFGGDFCDQSLLFCGDGICEPEFGEDEDNCPRDCSERCGNGTVEGDEECEPSEDDLECNEFCYYDVCGDGFVGAFEYCDAGMGTTEDPYMAAGGDQYCNEWCEFSFCSNAFVEEGFDTDTGEWFFEECDDGNLADGDGCASDCTVEGCGNGIIDMYADGTQEECDDGNTDDNDGCSSWCTEEYCGNGVTDMGEECDDYWYDEYGWPMYELYEYSAGETVDCTPDCTITYCGDGYTNRTAGESCDWGDENSDEPDAICRTDCTFGSCGDGILDEEYDEQCDEGLNNDDEGYCTTDCRINACGNGYVEDGWEECDPYVNSDVDGTTDDPSLAASMSDSCTDECLFSLCGDDIVNDLAGEECDPGTGAEESWYYADDNSADCTYYCTFSYCGDGITNDYAGEDCDPGYTCENGDDCTYSGVCDDSSACELRDTEECTSLCTFNTTDLLCCFDYDYENGYYIYEGETGYGSTECEEDYWGRPETYDEPIVDQSDVDYYCGYVGACCYIDQEGYDVAEASDWSDCDWYEGEYVPANEADANGDGSVTRSEAWTACGYEPEYVCADEGGTERRSDGGEVLDEDSYVVDGIYVTKDPNDPYCKAVYEANTCAVQPLAQVLLDGGDFYTTQGFCIEE